ncbi:MAG: ABC transporter permease subunit [Chloroflexota bacterium]
MGTTGTKSLNIANNGFGRRSDSADGRVLQHSTVMAGDARHALASVVGWELNRATSDWRSWLLVGAVFAGACLQAPLNSGHFDRDHLNFPIHSAFGLAVGYMQMLSIVFVAIGSSMVARDLSRRTHEVLMATPIPTWAYVWGRWLAGVLMCLGLSIVALLGIIAGGWVLQMAGARPAAYEMPDAVGLAIAFALIVPVDVFLLTGFSFTLGTLLPRWANLAIVAVVALWLVGMPVYAANYTDRANTWLPGHPFMLNAMGRYYLDALQDAQSSHASITFEQQVKLAYEVGTRMPDLSLWLWQLSYMGVGVVMVALTARYFSRFRYEL